MASRVDERQRSAVERHEILGADVVEDAQARAQTEGDGLCLESGSGGRLARPACAPRQPRDRLEHRGEVLARVEDVEGEQVRALDAEPRQHRGDLRGPERPEDRPVHAPWHHAQAAGGDAAETRGVAGGRRGWGDDDIGVGHDSAR